MILELNSERLNSVLVLPREYIKYREKEHFPFKMGTNVAKRILFNQTEYADCEKIAVQLSITEATQYKHDCNMARLTSNSHTAHC